MFGGGGLRGAPRHAIPPGGLPGTDPLPPAFGALRPRLNLNIHPAVAAPGSVFYGESLHDRLRRLYRGAFERLESEGRIDEAAFVLAELLQANEEAVAFLERHGRLRLA